MKFFKTAIALSAVAFIRATAGWEITFYSDDSCGSEPSFTSTDYHGGGILDNYKMDCLQPGAIGGVLDNCQWRVTTNGDTTYTWCTVATNPPPKSFWLQAGTRCHMSAYDGCTESRTFGKSHVGKCLGVDEIPNVSVDAHPDFFFWCEVEPN